MVVRGPSQMARCSGVPVLSSCIPVRRLLVSALVPVVRYSGVYSGDVDLDFSNHSHDHESESFIFARIFKKQPPEMFYIKRCS